MLAIRHYMCELTNKTLRRLLQEYQALSETKIFEHSLKFVFLGYCVSMLILTRIFYMMITQ